VNDAPAGAGSAAVTKAVAIVQSNYIPWKGYFDLIGAVDEFILYDDMQYTRRDWRNRNRIKTQTGPQWMTLAVESKGKYLQKIKDTVVEDPGWGARHWATLQHNYGRAPHFHDYRDLFAGLYLGPHSRYLSEINFAFLSAICSLLEIKTKLSWSMDYTLAEGKTERLVELCRQAGASTYLSGPAARDYMDESLFSAAGIALRYFDYSGYPEYPQLFPPFEHGVSVLDLLFNTGSQARAYLKNEHYGTVDHYHPL
jgi:hypothetical protein